ncbi:MULTISPECIES: hypothetical protein [Pyrococcus]|uniref:hypothetical protein n=1 Tax=Pyrococcus TaxID=2260 RepID=UPI000B310D3D|nr:MULTISPECIES: hypothetical protein [Pyrococcus]
MEFADYSENTKEKALQKLSSMVDEFLREKTTFKTLQRIGLTTFAIEIIKWS